MVIPRSLSRSLLSRINSPVFSLSWKSCVWSKILSTKVVLPCFRARSRVERFDVQHERGAAGLAQPEHQQRPHVQAGILSPDHPVYLNKNVNLNRLELSSFLHRFKLEISGSIFCLKRVEDFWNESRSFRKSNRQCFVSSAAISRICRWPQLFF